MQEAPYIVPPQRPGPKPEETDDRGDDQRVMPAGPHHESTVARSVQSGMMRPMKSLLFAAFAVLLAAPLAHAAPAKKAAPTKAAPAAASKKKYHFELTKVLAKPEVNADAAKMAQTRVEAVFKKALAEHPQLVADIGDAPDPATDNGVPYRKYLTKKGISGAYLVTVEITSASEEIVPLEDKKNSQRIVVSVGVHVLGETIPGRTMGFTGDGAATVKQEIGMKVRDKDREFTWDGAAETAINDALKTCFAKLALPQKKQ